MALTHQLANDGVFLQEASAIARWHGPALSGRVQHQDWGRSVLVREGKLYPILVAGYSGWVVGARWLPGRADTPHAINLYCVHSPTSTEKQPRDSYVGESLQIVPFPGA